MIRALLAVVTLVACPALASCASSPQPRFYTLAPQTGVSLPSRPLRIELRRPIVPGYLDRPQLVRRTDGQRLELAQDEHWGAPLQELVAITLAENLADRLPHAAVYRESSTLSSVPDMLVEVQLRRFELAPDGQVRLVAQVAVQRVKTPDEPRTQGSEDSAVARTRYASSLEPERPDTAAVVACMSDLLGRLADAVARIVVTEAQALGPRDTHRTGARAVLGHQSVRQQQHGAMD